MTDDAKPMSTPRLVTSAIGLGMLWLYSLGMIGILVFLIAHLVK